MRGGDRAIVAIWHEGATAQRARHRRHALAVARPADSRLHGTGKCMRRSRSWKRRSARRGSHQNQTWRLGSRPARSLAAPSFGFHVVHIWQKWLNRRSQKRAMPWKTVPPSPGPLPASADDGEALGHPSVAKPPVEEPDAAEPARPDLWGARVSDDPGLPDPETNTSQTSRQHTCRRRASCRRTAPGTRGRSCNVQLLDRMLVL